MCSSNKCHRCLLIIKLSEKRKCKEYRADPFGVGGGADSPPDTTECYPAKDYRAKPSSELHKYRCLPRYNQSSYF